MCTSKLFGVDLKQTIMLEHKNTKHGVIYTGIGQNNFDIKCIITWCKVYEDESIDWN